MRKDILLTLVALGLPLWLTAETKQEVIINGTTTNRQITRLQFDGDQVTATFSDNSSQTLDMESLHIKLTPITAGINHTTQQTYTPIAGSVYTLQGIKVANSLSDCEKQQLPKGIYIYNGKKIIIQ